MSYDKETYPLLQISELDTAFRQTEQRDVIATKNVSFQLNRGETLALVGESGSGKSVTGLSILGLLPYPQAYHQNGSIQFKGQEILGQSEEAFCKIRGYKIGMIFQEPMTALNPLKTIEQQIAEPLEIHLNLTKKQARNRVIDLLNLIGFPDGIDRLGAYPHQLSGGQRQRVMIAMALICEPELLIADEPTTALDVTIQSNIINLIQSLQNEFNMGLLLISHDLRMVAKISDQIAVMKSGEIIEQGLADQVLDHPQHPYTKHLIASEPQGSASPLIQTAPIIFEAKKIKVAFTKNYSFWDSFTNKKPEPLIAVHDVSLELKAGETIGIVGESGSGKSTLAYALLRLQNSQDGLIKFENQTLSALTLKEMQPLRKHLQIIFQDPFGSLNPRLNLIQIIAEGLSVHEPWLSYSEIDKKVCKILEEVGMEPFWKHRYSHELSGGQRQRIAIARALILRPKILILDEPTSALDQSIQAEIIALLKQLQKRYNLSYIFISHDLKVVRCLSHRIMLMKQGKIVETGLTEEIFTNPKADYTKNLIKASFGLGNNP